MFPPGSERQVSVSMFCSPWTQSTPEGWRQKRKIKSGWTYCSGLLAFPLQWSSSAGFLLES